jgi:coatomer protein complex subunit gamma
LYYHICPQEIHFSVIPEFCFSGDINQVDPSTGEAEGDGVEHEYRLENLEVVAADYMLPIGVVPNFWNIWKMLKPESERVREYSLVARESLAKSVSVVTSLLGMEICQVSC